MRGDSRTDSARRELHEHVVMQFRDEDDGIVAVAEVSVDAGQQMCAEVSGCEGGCVAD